MPKQKSKLMANYGQKAISLYHADLSPFEKGTWKSECPVCEDGLLLVGRDKNTTELEELDRCCRCAQEVRYADILTMRARDMLGLAPFRSK